MPQYFLNIFDTVSVPDVEGINKSNLESATLAAIEGARDVIAGDIRDGLPIHGTYRIEIADNGGQVLHTVRFADVIDFRP